MIRMEDWCVSLSEGICLRCIGYNDKENARPVERPFPLPNRENQVYSERSCLDAWLIQYPLPAAGASDIRFSDNLQNIL